VEVAAVAQRTTQLRHSLAMVAPQEPQSVLAS
jgi:hypothetical protein